MCKKKKILLELVLWYLLLSCFVFVFFVFFVFSVLFLSLCFVLFV